MNKTFKLIVAANYPNPPFFYTNEQGQISDGIDYYLIKTISELLNISYHFISSNSEWGKPLKNGSWSGMIGQIVDKKANIAIGDMTATNSRLKVVDFTTPYFHTDITFVMRMTKKSSINANKLLIAPFGWEVWLCLIFLIIISSALMKLVKQQMSTTLLFVARGLLQQGAPTIPKTLRLYAGLWFVFGLILSNSYVSVIFLLMSELLPKPEITSVTQLAVAVKNGRYKPSTFGGGDLFKLIKEINTSPLNVIGERLLAINTTNSALQMMLTNRPHLTYICPRLIINGRAAIFGPQFLYLPPKSDKSSFLMEQLTIGVPKNFIIKNQLNRIIRRLESSGQLYHWERISMRNNISRNKRNDFQIHLEKDKKGMNLEVFQYIIYLWTLGLFISSFVIVLEAIDGYLWRDRRDFYRKYSILDLSRHIFHLDFHLS